jgi:hypothetical protein
LTIGEFKMAAATYNLTIDQGSDFAVDLTIKEGGQLKDLSGYEARAHLRSTTSSSILVGEFICTVDSPGTSGKVKLELRNTQSSAIAAGRYVYDLEIYSSGDVIVKRLLKGEVILNPEVTR